MKVILINGSPHENGSTRAALDDIIEELQDNRIETKLYWVGMKAVHGCIACGKCAETGYCVFGDDPANACIDRIKAADGVVIGSPVYYAAPNGALCAMLDRVFYAGGRGFAYKPAAAVVSCRRGGSTAAFDRLNKYFTISNMPVVSSQYWNMVHGNTPEQVKQDLEGLQIMRTLGKNMAWLLKCIEKAALPPPEAEPHLWTNFIRE